MSDGEERQGLLRQPGTLLREGRFVTAERLARYPWIFIVLYLVALVALVVTTDARGIDAFDRPLGTDFSNVWSAGRLVLEGRPEAAYDPVVHYQAQQRGFDFEEVPYYGWHYPPMFLGVAAALALFPYLVALAIWMLLTLPLYLLALWSLWPRREVVLLALAFPATFVCLGHGQNAFFTTALLAGVFACMERGRPWLAGLLLGLLTYKPQFGTLFPLVLVLGGHWRVFLGACAGLALSAGTTTLWFGVDIWPIFLENSRWTREYVLAEGPTGWEKICSVFSAARMWGASVALASGLQTISGLGAAVVNGWLWWRRDEVSLEVRASAVTVGVLLATPYFLDYDLVVLAVPIVMLARLGMARGFLPWEKTALVALWLLPLVTRVVAKATFIPPTPLLLWAFLALLVVRARRDPEPEQGAAPSLSQTT